MKEVSRLINQFKALDFRTSISVEKRINMKDLITNTSILIPVKEKCPLIPEVICDENLSFKTKPFILMEVIKQLLENVCHHAYKNDEHIKAKITCIGQDSDLILTIKDYGKGIDAETLKKIFTPFSKQNLDSSGSGLGLSIVENLVVNGLGGEIDCDSKLGRGTVFTIRLRG